MQNYKQTGDVLHVEEAPYALDSGDGCQVGDALFGVASGDAESGAPVELKLTGVFELVKDAGTAWTQGDKVYWDNSAKECDVDASAGILIGVATVDAGSADVLALVRLNGVTSPLAEGSQAAVVTLTDSTTLSGTSDDTLSDAAVPVDITGGQSPTEAEHNAALASMRIVAQNTSDLAQKTIEILARLVSAGIIVP